MNVTCPECRAVYRVDPAKVIGDNVRAKCSACGAVIAVSEHVRWGDDFPDSRLTPERLTRSREAAAALRQPPERSRSAPGTRAPTPAPLAPPSSAPVGNEGARVPHFSSALATPVSGDTGNPRAPQSAAPNSSPPATDSTNARVPLFAPPRRTTPPGATFGAPSFPASTLRPPTPAFVPAVPKAPAFGAPFDAPPRPRPPIPGAPPRSGTTPAILASATPAPVSSPSAREPRPGLPQSSAVPAPAVPRKPLNPFLANDPNQKARRLARALVSDMIAYHPQKKAEGTQQGTLKQLFREEIKKSYEEYVEQVGRAFADGTSHFQDALNEILAGGKRLF